MKISVTVSGKTYKATLPYEGAERVKVEGLPECPSCGEGSPVMVYGGTSSHESHDTYRASAYHTCGQIGVIRVKMDTLFGLEEDERVLNGRMRVY